MGAFHLRKPVVSRLMAFCLFLIVMHSSVNMYVYTRAVSPYAGGWPTYVERSVRKGIPSSQPTPIVMPNHNSNLLASVKTFSWPGRASNARLRSDSQARYHCTIILMVMRLMTIIEKTVVIIVVIMNDAVTRQSRVRVPPRTRKVFIDAGRLLLWLGTTMGVGWELGIPFRTLISTYVVPPSCNRRKQP